MVLMSVGASRLLEGTAVMAKPTGEVKAKGSITTTGDWQTVCELTVTSGKTFHPAKLTASCDQDFVVKLTFDGEDLSVEYYVAAYTPLTDWYPWNWGPCEGDGTKKVTVEGKYPSGGAAGTLFAEVCGEEV